VCPAIDVTQVVLLLFVFGLSILSRCLSWQNINVDLEATRAACVVSARFS